MNFDFDSTYTSHPVSDPSSSYIYILCREFLNLDQYSHHQFVQDSYHDVRISDDSAIVLLNHNHIINSFNNLMSCCVVGVSPVITRDCVRLVFLCL